jgi:hypothetical protein
MQGRVKEALEIQSWTYNQAVVVAVVVVSNNEKK